MGDGQTGPRPQAVVINLLLGKPMPIAAAARFYEEAGAIRDVVQNHLLQLLAILMMDPPGGNSPDAIRDEKTRLLKAVKPLEPDHVVRGQYRGYRSAAGAVRDNPPYPVPLHIRNAPTRLMKDLGYGDNYRYAHDEEGAVAAGETYLPEDMPPVKYYHPVPRGLELQIREKLAEIARRNQPQED